jgi:YggT family protein
MFLFANVFETMATLIYWLMSLLDLYSYILVARVVISWIDASPYNPLVRFICRVTDPLLNRINRYMPNVGGLDLSPLVVFFAIMVIKKIVLKTAYQYLMLSSQNLGLKGIF